MDKRPQGASGPSLLLELEPAHRIFLRNLEDTLRSRTPPPVSTTSKPGHFWSDVFVPAGPPWSALLESFLWHLAIISVVLAVSHVLALQEARLPQRVSRHQMIVYPTPTYPAVGSGGPRRPPKPLHETQRQAALRVQHERTSAALVPPSLKSVASKLPSIAGERHAAPLFAPKLPESKVPTGPTAAIAPPPDIRQAIGHRSSLPANPVVRPAPGLASVSERKTHAADIPVVAPPAELAARGQHSRPGASLASANVVVPPPPSQATSRTSSRGRSLSGNDVAVIPPASEINGITNTVAGRRASSLIGGSSVVPPAASVSGIEGETKSGNRRRLESLSGSGSQVVSPAANLSGGLVTGKSKQAGQLSGGPEVVPPAPNLGAGSGSSAPGRLTALSAGGLQVVPPVPSLQGTGGGTAAGGRASASLGSGGQAIAPVPTAVVGGGLGQSKLGSLSGDASQVAPPASANISASGAKDRPMAATQAVEPATNVSRTSDPATIELPVRVIGLAVSLPNTSYFSNYEVFIAERKKSKSETELIKLVYVSLPYQRRLSDYGFDNSKVYKLRVTRDKTCDETLLQMTWPQTDEKHSGSRYATGPPALAPGETNNLLPCYRTTADDYIKAVTGH